VQQRRLLGFKRAFLKYSGSPAILSSQQSLPLFLMTQAETPPFPTFGPIPTTFHPYCRLEKGLCWPGLMEA
jgi:hypothetical protein